MIFHVPFALNPDSASASGIRPVKMRRAFEDAGYLVLEISGNHEQRRGQIKELRRRIRAGLRPDFVYSESATNPTGLGEKVTRHTSWARDIRFLQFCRRKGIPVGLFYRDIYWAFPEFGQALSRLTLTLMMWRYRADLRGYSTGVDVLFVPSIGMTDFIPIQNKYAYYPLPSGTERVLTGNSGKGVGVLYVGGIGEHYRMHEAFRGTRIAAAGGADVRFRVCTRKQEWVGARENYEPLRGTSISVAHASGQELECLFAESNVGSLFVEPSLYRDFAVPMKLYDYIGHGMPVIASEGTLVGQVVREWNIGWTIPYNAEAWSDLIHRLDDDPLELEVKRRSVLKISPEQTWLARAREVAEVLGNVSLR